MENRNNAIIVITIPATDLQISYPSDSQLHRSTLTSIYNAWTSSAGIDKYGSVWVETSKLHIILRKKDYAVRHFLDNDVQQENKTTVQGKSYVKGTEVMKLIDRIIQSPTSMGTQEKYARVSQDLYLQIRDSDKAQLLRHEENVRIKKYRGELKRARISRYTISKDELTGEKLYQSEFSHIRSYSIYYDLADKIWNGLVINKATHKIITKEGISNEEQLFKLCYDNQWNTDWYEDFLDRVKDFYN